MCGQDSSGLHEGEPQGKASASVRHDPLLPPNSSAIPIELSVPGEVDQTEDNVPI